MMRQPCSTTRGSHTPSSRNGFLQWRSSPPMYTATVLYGEYCLHTHISAAPGVSHVSNPRLGSRLGCGGGRFASPARGVTYTGAAPGAGRPRAPTGAAVAHTPPTITATASTAVANLEPLG